MGERTPTYIGIGVTPILLLLAFASVGIGEGAGGGLFVIFFALPLFIGGIPKLLGVEGVVGGIFGLLTVGLALIQYPFYGYCIGKILSKSLNIWVFIGILIAHTFAAIFILST